jgi:methionyl-tRNA synthetase
MSTVLYVLCEVIRHVAVYVQPVMPESAGKILDQLGQDERTFESLRTPLKVGTALCEPAPIFPRIER